MNFCTGCGEDFGSVSAFDAHRIGAYPRGGPSEYTERLERGLVETDAKWRLEPLFGRRCLTPVELIERGWTRDGRGRWRQHSQGAPWASSQDQAITQRRRQLPAKGQSRRKPRDRSARLPDSRKGTARK
jgi:hypothetical protein